MFNVSLTGDHLYGKWEVDVRLAVAGEIFDGVLFCAVFFPTRFFGWDLGLN